MPMPDDLRPDDHLWRAWTDGWVGVSFTRQAQVSAGCTLGTRGEAIGATPTPPVRTPESNG